MNATYLHLIDLASQRYRTGRWTLAEVYEFSSQLQERFEREYGATLTA